MLGGATGAETQARRSVQNQPHLELVVGDGVSDMWIVGACGHGPVDVTWIVTGDIRAGLTALGAVTGEQPGVVAG
jgi:hypothetical protein